MKKIFKNKTLLGIAVILIIWQILHLIIRSNIIPSPFETINALIKLIKGNLIFHILFSLYRIIIAICISLMIGVPVGIWIGLKKRADQFISPLIYILYPVPKIALLPIFIVLFGLGDLSKITIIVAIISFQILIFIRDGIKNIPSELFISAISLGLNKRQILYHLVLPATLPKIISAVRISLGVSIAVLFFAENFATTYGIGYFIMNSWIMVNYVQMFAGILALSLMGIILFKLIDLSEKKLCKWLFIKSAETFKTL